MSLFDNKKLNLISSPTLFHELTNLQKALAVKPRLFIKRDDLTEIGLGGNKNRKLDYIMADAIEQGADCIITWGGAQSNHCRQTLSYANILGMECHLMINGKESETYQGNLLIFNIFDAKLHYEPDESKCPEACEKLAEELRSQGKKPYYIPLGASVALGSLGYIDSIREISEQAKQFGVNIAHLFVASGSAGTQAGLEVGARLFMPVCKIHGVSVSRSRGAMAPKVADQSNLLAKFINQDMVFKPEDICIHDEYYGEAYAIPTKSGIEAIKLVGRTQSILLDPVYTGKAMDGMIDCLKKGLLDEAEAVVFLHTGGSPAVFNFAECFYK